MKNKINKFMKEAIKEAFRGMRKGHGGPFGAVIVKNSRIISRAHNEVLKTNDPTMHAEITAIREATRRFHCFNLSGCELYTTCEPCPMCLAAIHWARIKKVYYGATKEDAASIGFDDKLIYDIINKKTRKKFSSLQIDRKECLSAFETWCKKEGKRMY